METYSNRKLATSHVIGALHTGARAADASAARLPSLLLMLTLLMTGCVVVPIPANRPDPSVRTNITPETVNHLGAGDVSRTDVLLQLGEPDEVSLEERQFRSEEHTSELQHLGISYAVFCLKKKMPAPAETISPNPSTSPPAPSSITPPSLVFFFLMIRPPPRSTLFPSTTLFRSPLPPASRRCPRTFPSQFPGICFGCTSRAPLFWLWPCEIGRASCRERV